MISRLTGGDKGRRHWSKFKDEKDVSSAQRKQDLAKIARNAEVTEHSTPAPWKPKWMRERDRAIAEAEAALAEKHAQGADGADGADGAAGPVAPRARTKPCVFLGFLGPSGAGKSTLLGHLTYQTGGCKKATVDKYEKTLAAQGAASRKFAWVVDDIQLERERQATVRVSRRNFQTARFLAVGVDVPGHRMHLRNLMHGVALCDAVVLVVDAVPGRFEAQLCGTPAGGQLHEQAFVAHALGIRQIICAVNKMDDPAVDYSEARFHVVRRRLLELLVQVFGFAEAGVSFVPVCATDGDNLIPPDPLGKNGKRMKSRYYGIQAPNENMLWWEGGTFTDAVDRLVLPLPAIPPRPLRIPVSEVFQMKGVGTVAVGRIVSGSVNVRDVLRVCPGPLDYMNLIADDDHEDVDDLESDEEEEEEEEEVGKKTQAATASEAETKTGGAPRPGTAESRSSRGNSNSSSSSSSNNNNNRPGTAESTTTRSSRDSSAGNRRPGTASSSHRSVGSLGSSRNSSGRLGSSNPALSSAEEDDEDWDDEDEDSETEEELAARLSMGERAKVKARHMWHQKMPNKQVARVGDYVAVKLAALNKSVGKRGKGQRPVPLVRPGTVLGPLSAAAAAHTVASFTATIFIYNLRGGTQIVGGGGGTTLGVGLGWAPIVDVHTAHVPCRLGEILYKRSRGQDDRKDADGKTNDGWEDEWEALKKAEEEAELELELAEGGGGGAGRGGSSKAKRLQRLAKLRRDARHAKKKDKDPAVFLEARRKERRKATRLKNGDCCDVKLVPLRPLCVEPFDVLPALSRFVLRDSNYVVGAGIVKSVVYGMHAGKHNIADSSDEESSSEEEEDLEEGGEVDGDFE